MSRSTYNAEKKVWSDNGPSPLFNPKISVGEIAFKALITNGPRIAQVTEIQKKNIFIFFSFYFFFS